MADVTPKITDIRDFPTPQRDGTVLQQKRVQFFLGNFGPFVEYFPSEGFSMLTVNQRIEALKRELEGMPH